MLLESRGDDDTPDIDESNRINCSQECQVADWPMHRKCCNSLVALSNWLDEKDVFKEDEVGNVISFCLEGMTRHPFKLRPMKYYIMLLCYADLFIVAVEL